MLITDRLFVAVLHRGLHSAGVLVYEANGRATGPAHAPKLRQNRFKYRATLTYNFLQTEECPQYTVLLSKKLGMSAVFAEFERESLRDRVKAGIAQARKQSPPYAISTHLEQ
jgi:hypothetical protein